MTPEEIKQANALIAQVVDDVISFCVEYPESTDGPRFGHCLQPFSTVPSNAYRVEIPCYDIDAAALMRVEEWLMTQEVSFVSHFEHGQYYWFAKTWHSTPSGNVCKEHKGCADSNMEAKYQCYLFAIRWIVEQAGSIKAAREWKP